MFAQERHQRILDLLAKRKRLSAPQLQAALNASAATVRRDVEFLARAGHVLRTHGGILHPDTVETELSFDRKARAAIEAKRTIAETVAALVPDGSTVFVDAGTTTLAAGRLLLARPTLTVFTNSLPLLGERLPEPSARLVAVGGEVRPVSLALVGDAALAWLGRLRFDFALLGASGLAADDGPSTTELAEAGVKANALARAARVVVLADATKWARPAAIRYAAWDEIDDLVTDHAPEPSARRALAVAKVSLHLP